jgi:type I restriction enzyme S subunit
MAMSAARAERRSKLTEADALLGGLDGFLLASLGLTAPPRDDRKVFAVRRRELEGRQIGANVYAPALRNFLRMLSIGPFPTRSLREEVAINPAVSLGRLTDDTPVSFVPMEAVENNAAGGITLETRTLSEVRKGYTPFADGDVLWAKITPCMENGKSGIVRKLKNGVGFGSTEFHVLRPLSARVSAEYVHEFVSQWALRRVARFAFTGSAGHQRVPQEFLAELPFPVPPLDVQERIAAEARRRREEAHRLRADAEGGWQAAKHRFEEQLLGITQS